MDVFTGGVNTYMWGVWGVGSRKIYVYGEGVGKQSERAGDTERQRGKGACGRVQAGGASEAVCGMSGAGRYMCMVMGGR